MAGEQWWCVVMRALPSHQCGPGPIPRVDAIRGLSLLLVLSLAPRGFSLGTSVFPSPQKPTFPISNSTRNRRTTMWMCYLQIIIYFIYFFIFWGLHDLRVQWAMSSFTQHAPFKYIQNCRGVARGGGGSWGARDPPLVGLLLSKQPTIFRWRKRYDNILAVKAIVEKPTFFKFVFL